MLFYVLFACKCVLFYCHWVATRLQLLVKISYHNILRFLRDVVRRKCPEKWRINSWFLLHNNVPAHQSVLDKDFLATNNVTTLELSPYTPDLAPVDLCMFPQLKSVLEGRCVCDVSDIIKNAMEELKILSQNGFQECFQHFYSHWQKCLVAQWDYLEGNEAYSIVLFCVFQK